MPSVILYTDGRLLRRIYGRVRRRREAVFQPEFIEDLRYWVETDRKRALRALDLNRSSI